MSTNVLSASELIYYFFIIVNENDVVFLKIVNLDCELY